MYKKIMVPLDGSKLAECVLPHLETVVRGCKNTPEVFLVQAVEPISIPYGSEMEKITSIEQLQAFETHYKTQAEKYLINVVDQLAKVGINASANIVYGKPADALHDFATMNNVDLVIIATHGRSGVNRWGWGSVAIRLIQSVSASFMVIRAPGY
jgi:nucleotide-binding universal stress UspA family protein